MAVHSVDSGSLLINPNAKVHIAETEDTQGAAQQKTIETHKHTLEEIFSGDADTVEISDEARSLSRAAQELAEKQAALEEESENGAVVIQAETAGTETASTSAKAPTVVVSEPSSELYGKEDRKNTGEYYSSVLEDFRSRYSEEEAMRRFDDFMESEGFERGPSDSTMSTFPGTLNSPGGALGNLYSMGSFLFALEHGLGMGGLDDSRLTLSSTIGVAEINDEYRIFAESVANFYAYNSDATRGVVADWANQYADQFAEVSGMDMNELRDALGWKSDYVAIAGADRDLGSTMMDIVGEAFQKAGVEFSGNEQLNFSLTYDEQGNATGITADYLPAEWELSTDAEFRKYLALQDDINKQLSNAVANDPSLLDSFSAMSAGVPMTTADSLDGAFSDGDRGVSYGVSRSFVISAAQPDTMVMSDSLRVYQTGYTYHKKTDAFDPEADKVVLSIPKSFSGHEDPALDEMGQHVKDAIVDAIDNGGQIESEMDRATYEDNKVSGIPGLQLVEGPQGEMYDARTGERIDENFDWSKAEQMPEEILEEEPEVEEEAAAAGAETSSVYDDKDSARRSAVENLLFRARSNNDMQTVNMLNNLMTSLRDFYGKKAE